MTELFPGIDFASSAYCASCAQAAKGALYLVSDVFDRADAEFLEALELCPTSSIPILWLGISARKQENFSLAEQYLDRIRESDAMYVMAQNAKALVRTVQKTPDEKSAALWRDLSMEHKRLFSLTFDGLSGKAVRERATHKLSDGLRASRYIVMVDDYPEKNKHLVYNTFTRAMVTVGDELRDFIYDPGSTVGREVSKDMDVLKKMGILVNREADDTTPVRKWYSTFTGDMAKARMHISILTTYDCNFACRYCLQEGVKKPVYMDDKCAYSLAEWLINKMEENKTKELSISLYGGEPFLNKKPMRRILENLHRYTIEKGILLVSSVTTNGSLIDRELLQELTQYGLRTIKVTVDGEKEIHDTRRPFKSGKGSFDVIIKNINRIPESVKLTIQANLDEENADSFPCLLDYFERSGMKDRIDNIFVSSIMESLSAASMLPAREIGCEKLSDSAIGDKLIQMKKLVVERGFKSNYDNIHHVLCAMDRNGASLVIDPMGVIYSCSSFVGREGFSVGSIYNPKLNLSESVSPEQLEECFYCTYFPVCGGGCRYMAYLTYGDLTRVFCERRFIEHQTKEFIKLIYHQQKAKKELSHNPQSGSMKPVPVKSRFKS